MKKGILGTHVVTQVGILVHDIEKTAQVYADFLGVQKPNIQVTDVIDEVAGEVQGHPDKGAREARLLQGGRQRWTSS